MPCCRSMKYVKSNLTRAHSILAYWNEPQGKRDEEFVSPFKVSESPGKTKYLTFEPDGGGWNNIRMSMEVSVITGCYSHLEFIRKYLSHHFFYELAEYFCHSCSYRQDTGVTSTSKLVPIRQ